MAKLPDPLHAVIDCQQERVVNAMDPGAGFAVARTASKDNPEALQGFHEDNLLFLFDEASGIPDVVYEIGMGALSTQGAKVVMAGNPTRNAGMFYDTHHKLRANWHTQHVSCLDVPEAQGHIDDVRAKYGENSNAWRVRVLGEFPTASDETIMPLDLVLSAVGRDVKPLNYLPVWGLDVARFGDDRTALAKRQANVLIEPVKTWKNLDVMQVAGTVQREYEETPLDYRPSDILVDAIGLGAGVYDVCKSLRLPVREVNVGEAAATRENCMRLRDELWFKGREWFLGRDVAIPQDDDLIGELTNVMYHFTVTGKFQAESKDDMKKRGMRSPDLADAFLLTFACGLKRKIDHHRNRHRKTPESNWAA